MVLFAQWEAPINWVASCWCCVLDVEVFLPEPNIADHYHWYSASGCSIGSKLDL